MNRDTLFLLAPGFEAEGRREYCPECAEIWGFLHYFPAILQGIEIVYQPLAHPRPAIAALLGEGRWNCPTLVLAADSPGSDIARLGERQGRRYIDNARDIGKYFAGRYGTPVPRGG